MIRDDNYRKVHTFLDTLDVRQRPAADDSNNNTTIIVQYFNVNMSQTSKLTARKEVEYTAEELADALYECRDPEK